MAEHPIWGFFDIFWVIVGIVIVLSVIVIDFFFCNSYHGFCIFKWAWNAMLCTPLTNSAWWPPTKALVMTLCKVGDFIPL